MIIKFWLKSGQAFTQALPQVDLQTITQRPWKMIWDHLHKAVLSYMLKAFAIRSSMRFRSTTKTQKWTPRKESSSNVATSLKLRNLSTNTRREESLLYTLWELWSETTILTSTSLKESCNTSAQMQHLWLSLAETLRIKCSEEMKVSKE
jgi:hypothetical protein